MGLRIPPARSAAASSRKATANPSAIRRERIGTLKRTMTVGIRFDHGKRMMAMHAASEAIVRAQCAEIYDDVRGPRHAAPSPGATSGC